MDALIANVKEVFVEDYGLSMGKNPEQIFRTLAGLCKRYSIDADDLAGTWLAYAATKNIGDIDEAMLIEFEKQELSNKKAKEDKPHISISDLNLKASEEIKVEVYGKSSSFMDLDSDNEVDNDGSDLLQAYGVTSTYVGTPKVDKKPTSRLKNAADTPKSGFSPAGYSPAIDSKSVSYEARTKAGDTVLRYKCKDSEYWSDTSGSSEVPIKVVPTSSTNTLLNSRSGFKYMFQKTMDMAAALNSLIVQMGLDILNEDDEKELQDLRVSSVEECWYLGRIRNDDGRLSQASTFLEGDLEVSDGHVVSLDLSGAEEYRLFPGQVVLLKGKNEMGKCLRVTEVAVTSPLPLPNVVPKQTRPLNIVVASGPFSPIDSLQYEPLTDLLAVLKRDTPDICILVGPFIDPSHPMIAGGEVAELFEDFFENILEKIFQSIRDINTHIVVVSSCKDAHHHAVFPTPPYSLRKRYDKITILPDPAMFEIAGITFGFTSVDILKHLANSEISKSTITDRMGGLSKLILSQRNFYPLYPPDESLPLDVQLWTRHCKFTKTPHILVLPSDLRYFIKEVEGTIIINPERLTKGKSGGTYSRIQVKLPDLIETEVQSIADFCCGEIIKI